MGGCGGGDDDDDDDDDGGGGGNYRGCGSVCNRERIKNYEKDVDDDDEMREGLM